MNFEDGYIHEELEDFIIGRVYAIKLKDIKQISYTNLNEPYYDFDLPRILDEEKKYGKVYSTITLDGGSFMERLRFQQGIILAEYIGNDCFQDREVGTILNLITCQSESFSSLDKVEEDIACYYNNYLSIEKNAIHMFDEKIEKKYHKFREKVDDVEKLLKSLNSQAEQSLQINFIRLGTNEIMDAVYEGRTTGESKKLVREIQQIKRKIVK